jgi:phage terminase large subunit GpA-like protein
MRITQKFSTPTFVGYGIDKSYKLTDQREYEIRCPACNHWQIPLFTPKFVHCPEFEASSTSRSSPTSPPRSSQRWISPRPT